MGLKSNWVQGATIGYGYAPCMGLKRRGNWEIGNRGVYAPCMGLKSE